LSHRQKKPARVPSRRCCDASRVKELRSTSCRNLARNSARGAAVGLERRGPRVGHVYHRVQPAVAPDRVDVHVAKQPQRAQVPLRLGEHERVVRIAAVEQ